MTTPRYRAVRDEYGARLLRDGVPITLEEACEELNALASELDTATKGLNGIYRALRRIVNEAEQLP